MILYKNDVTKEMKIELAWEDTVLTTSILAETGISARHVWLVTDEESEVQQAVIFKDTKDMHLFQLLTDVSKYNYFLVDGTYKFKINKKIYDINNLPDNLKVGGWLDLRNTQISSLPDNLTVGGNLWLNNTQISSLPDNLEVADDLYLSNTPISSLPDNLKVGRSLDLRDTPISSLPDNLRVGTDLWLRNTQISSLPDNLEVAGDLWLRDTQIPQNYPIPKGVKGEVYR